MTISQQKSRMKHWGTLLAIGVGIAGAFIAVMVVVNRDETPPPNSSSSAPRFPLRAPQFDLSPVTVDVREIHGGGPPKDGIPALTRPRMIPAALADHLSANDRVIGVVIDGQARAYSLAILNYHEIVNDIVGEIPIAATYCPLCDSVAVYDRRTPLGEREFGVSGLLYNSNVLMYDRGGQPESLWSQVQTKGISGPAAGRQLTAIPCELTTWGSWQARHPDTLVLSPNTGHTRDYTRNPYEAYLGSRQLMFPAEPVSMRLPAKERVLGVWVDDEYRAYPESRFRADQAEVADVIGGKSLTIAIDRTSHSMRVVSADEGVSWLYSFWFAWYAVHPNTTIYGDTPPVAGSAP
jgi:hypothetical protein